MLQELQLPAGNGEQGEAAREKASGCWVGDEGLSNAGHRRDAAIDQGSKRRRPKGRIGLYNHWGADGVRCQRKSRQTEIKADNGAIRTARNSCWCCRSGYGRKTGVRLKASEAADREAIDRVRAAGTVSDLIYECQKVRAKGA